MTPFATNVSFVMSLGTLLLGLLTVYLIYTLVVKKTPKFFETYALQLAFLAALAAMVGSLVYSEIIGFAPCELCWINRIFLYPQAFIFGVALYRKMKKKSVEGIASYGLSLSIPGIAVAIYQYYGQMFNNGILPCSASAVSCAQRPFVDFGYITIPMMSLTVFAFLITLMVTHIRAKR